ncbi:hypothetical protein HmCmsJML003_02547 [Escherichia coli]|nr:hypothetical protein HmCmsJML003_02547 [Escherichia coli]
MKRNKHREESSTVRDAITASRLINDVEALFEKGKGMDKELPWLADNAQLELKYKKGKTPLSHRNWPGEPVPVITESIIQTLGDEWLQKAEKKKKHCLAL